MTWTPSPTKVIGIGTNYRLHAEEMGRAIPAVPKVFLMPPSAVIGPDDAMFCRPDVGSITKQSWRSNR